MYLYSVTPTLLQLVWNLCADVNLKAWTCGVILCHMAGAAGRMQVALGRQHTMQLAHSGPSETYHKTSWRLVMVLAGVAGAWPT